MPDNLTELNEFKPKDETPEELIAANKELHEILLGLQRCIELAKRDLAEKNRRENK